MEIKNYFDIIRRWWWVAALCTAMAAGAGYLLAADAERIYEARARYLVGPVISSPATNSDDLRVSLQAGQTYRDIVGSQLVIEQASERLGLTESEAAGLRERVAADWNSNSQTLTVRARAGSPQEAADIVEALGATLIALGPNAPDSLSNAGRDRIRDQITELERQEEEIQAAIVSLTGAVEAETDLDTQRARIVALDQRRDDLAKLQRDLTALYQLDQSRIKNQLTLLDPPALPRQPIEPDTERYILSALMGGLAVGAAAVLLLAYIDRSLRSPADLSAAARARYLGGVARRTSRNRPAMGEQYRTIAFGLETMEQRPASLLLSSPGHGEGRSELALGLGMALAQMGRKVILVDADLQRRGLSRLLARCDLKPAGHVAPEAQPGEAGGKDEGLTLMQVNSAPGLLTVLMAEVEPFARGGAGLRLPEAWLDALSSRADYLIIDGDRAAAPDTMALSRQVDGVLLVAAEGLTSDEDATRAAESLRVAGAQLIGVVMTGLTSRSPYDYAPAAEPAPPAEPQPEGAGRAPAHRPIGYAYLPGSDGALAGARAQVSRRSRLRSSRRTDA